MRIIMEEPLKEYMEENKIKDIVVEVGICIACGGQYNNVQARFPREDEVFDPNDYDIYESDYGHIYLAKENIEYGDTLRLIWKNYYFSGLGVSGAKAINPY